MAHILKKPMHSYYISLLLSFFLNLDFILNNNEAMILCYATGASRDAPLKDYSLSSSKFNRAMDAFSSISILASVFGTGILPEIQVIK